MSMYYQKLLSLKKNPKDKILILGLGVENKQFLEWLVRSELSFPVNQIILADLVTPEFESLNIDDYEIITGKKYLDSLKRENIKMVIKAPGIWSFKKELKIFRKTNGSDSVLSSLTFFMEKYRQKIIGVTGTKGKTTTCSLIHHLLKDDYEIYYCGNTTGISPYRYWNSLNAYFVIELSSFQLQDLGTAKLSPKYAGITNLFIDHLDQHKTVLEYHKAKENLWKYQKPNSGDICIYSSQVGDKMAEMYSKAGKLTNLKSCNEVNQINIEGLKNIFKINLAGDHNYINLSIAASLVEIINSSPNDIKKNLNSSLSKIYTRKEIYQKKLNNFQTPQGRLELVNQILKNGITISFYNDNTATEPDAVIAGIEALKKENSVTVLILAGKVKEGDYNKLAEVIKKNTKNNSIIDVKYFGEIGSRMRELINPKSVYNGNLKDFLSEEKNYIDEVVKLLQKKQTEEQNQIGIQNEIKNINILFSPAGSSFDEFKNYLERQEFYLNWVKEQALKD